MADWLLPTTFFLTFACFAWFGIEKKWSFIAILIGGFATATVAAIPLAVIASMFGIGDEDEVKQSPPAVAPIETSEAAPAAQSSRFMPAPTMNMLVNSLDAKKLIVGLPLKNRQVTTSGDYKKKQLWDIDGFETSTLEIIGDDQSDADVMAWTCHEYDSAGEALSAARAESRCRLLLIDVLRKLVDSPIEMANYMVTQVADGKNHDAYLQSGPFTIEANEGGFYFVRHLSEQEKLKRDCGMDYHTPRVGMPLEKAKKCLPGLRLTGEYGGVGGVLSEYEVGRIHLSVMDGKVVSWNRF